MASRRSRDDGAGNPQERIRSIYAARTAASGRLRGGEFSRMTTVDPDRSLRAAYVSHLSAAKDEVPRGSRRPGESALRKAYVAKISSE